MIKKELYTTPKYFTWTKTAVYCYKRGGNCRGCPIKEDFEQECKMKYSVISLVREIGTPKGDK